jgi:hypothetical protein
MRRLHGIVLFLASSGCVDVLGIHELKPDGGASEAGGSSAGVSTAGSGSASGVSGGATSGSAGSSAGGGSVEAGSGSITGSGASTGAGSGASGSGTSGNSGDAGVCELSDPTACGDCDGGQCVGCLWTGDSGFCGTTGMGEAGDSCSSTTPCPNGVVCSSCAPGFFCSTGNSRSCQQWCKYPGGSCPPTMSCHSFPTPAFSNGQEYGSCY